MTRLTTLLTSLCLAFAALATPAAAQNPFAPRVIVNDRVITGFEVEQRRRFLALFNTPGDLEALAVERLIEEELQLFAARRLGVEVSDDDLAQGMAEFASRVELSTDEFIAAIAESGIEPESFVEFVRAGIAWREVVRARWAGRISITDADIDRALSLTNWRGEVRFLLAEIVLPDTPELRQQVQEIAAQVAQITSVEVFADAAQQFSVSESAQRGGRIDWVPAQNLPEEVRSMLLQMRPGQVTAPIPVENAIILLQLRGTDRQDRLAPAETAVDYARVLIPGAGTEAAAAEIARLRNRADTCVDLEALTGGANYERVTSRLSEVPGEVALELARIDEREMTANLRRGEAQMLLMLCARMPAVNQEADRDAVGNQLLDDRATRLSAGYLQELRADAHIRFP